VLLLGIALGLAPLWWREAGPARLETVMPWRDPGGALMVPAAAVRRGSAGEALVFVIQEGVPRPVRVVLGTAGPESVVILTGLRDGTVVAANPPPALMDRRWVAQR
jgi:multidrug efflux pump subunit AcrA (membrane-fusion protein)